VGLFLVGAVLSVVLFSISATYQKQQQQHKTQQKTQNNTKITKLTQNTTKHTKQHQNHKTHTKLHKHTTPTQNYKTTHKINTTHNNHTTHNTFGQFHPTPYLLPHISHIHTYS
jgi:uncharacterized protein HemX